jgi:ubiquitin-like domain-containing CTD phosphatase 1
MSESAEQITLVVKWAGKEYPIEDFPLTSTVSDLKKIIGQKTNVLPERQKLLNLRHKGTFSVL